MNIDPEILFGIGALVLLVGMFWAMVVNRRRNRANDRVTDAATRDLYNHPDGYQQRRGEYEKQLRPK